MTHERSSRRAVLSAGALVGAGLLAGCTGGGGDGSGTDGSGPRSFGGWLEPTGNYDGVVDETGRKPVTVAVGAEANGGHFGFEPAAVRVDPGAEVVWEWTGEGALHDVVAADGDFRSQQTQEAGFRFSRAVEETTRYYRTPHRALGMRGVVVVA